MHAVAVNSHAYWSILAPRPLVATPCHLRTPMAMWMAGTASAESEDIIQDEEKAVLFQYLSQSRVNKEALINIIIPHLMSKGFESVDDLRDLELKYLDNDGESVETVLLFYFLKVSNS